MKTTGMTSPSALLTLPSELIQAVLICSCSPRTVASVAQTCRALHTLIYASPDSHLWRELFLTIWDDPRPALEHRSLVDPRIDPAGWDWATEYRRRVSADRWLKAWRRDICLTDAETPAERDAGTDTERYITALSALSAVLNTLLTLRPFPASPLIALADLTPASAISLCPTGNVGSGVGDRERMTSAPPLPPLLIVLVSGISAFQESRSGVRVGRMVYGPHASRAATAELAPIPTPSLPPQLVRTLLASRAVAVRGLPAHVPFLSTADDWGNDPLGEVFHRIICITGFVPIPPPLVATSTSTSTSTSTPISEFISDHTRSASVDTEVLKNQDTEIELGRREDGELEQHKDHDHHESGEQSTPTAFPTPSQQHADARTLARRRVYDMRYLRGDCLWGPFHPVTREALGVRPEATRLAFGKKEDVPRKGGKRASTSSASSGSGWTYRLGTLAWAIGVDIEPDDFDSTSDDSKDEDWRDPADTGKESSSSSESEEREREPTNGSGDTVVADPDVEPIEPEHPLISLIHSSTISVDTEPTTSTSTASTASRRRTRRSNPRLPRSSLVSPRQIKPHHLRPDYVYLASARIVVEANLRELFGAEKSDDVEGTASEVRAGGVGMFWEDEDDILGARAGPSEPASSLSCSSLSPTTTPSGIPAINTNSTTFNLADTLSRFHNLEVARLGSTCGYWSGWTERQQSATRTIDEDVDASESASEGDIGARKPRIVAQRDQLEKPIEGTAPSEGKGKGKEKDGKSAVVPALGTGLGDWEIGPEGEACEGWDWAGVSGIWRRCVCWMDYRELLFFNLDSTKFLTLDVQEACRIIPMELRITGYTRAGLMPVNDVEPTRLENINTLPSNSQSKRGVRTGYFRPPPVIHFSGSSVGSDRGLDDGRTVEGSVQLIGGGEVRWQMDTYTQESTMPGTTTPEWSSEAVQVGGIGSAVGVLGMWTGAGHERADPLGPFWAWKVT
ncbi:hypothetical protein J3R82DRAFT_7824 [Butyriboletus roseoflavus]|nr:hypothetical protein J3R82DRAFT_7824 [Butyriboletus roseoflavus]